MSRNFLYSAISAGSAVLLLLLSIVIVAALGQEAWGNFSFALSLSMIGEALMDFGIQQVTIRSIARDRTSAAMLFRNTLALKMLPGAAMLVVMTVLVFLLRPEPELRLVCVLMLVSAVLRSYLLTVRGVLQGLEQFGDDARVVIADRVLVLVIGSAAVWGGAHLVGLAIAFVAARLVAVAGALIVAHPHVGPPRPEINPPLWRDLQRRALPLGGFLIVLNLYSYIDTIILRSMATALETGLYSSAYRLYEGLSYVPAILSSVLTPRLSNLWGVDRPAHRRLATRGIAAALGAALGLSVITWVAAPYALRIFGAEAVLATTALRILGLGLAFVFVIWMLHAIAISVFAERLLFQTTVIGTIANVLLNLVLIPRYGRNGAALATVLGEAVTMSVLMWTLIRAVRAAEATS